MSKRSRAKRNRKQIATALQPQATYSADHDYWYSAFGPKYAGVTVTPDTAMQVSAVYACVRVLSETIASLPLHVYRRTDKGKVKATTNPLYDILHSSPNGWQTSMEWVEMLTAQAVLRGNAYCYKTPGGELIPLNPDRMQVYQQANGDLLYVYQPSGGDRRTYLQEEIFHLRGLSFDGVLGVSPISYVAKSIGISIATETHAEKTFENGAVIKGVLEHPGRLSRDAAANLRESWSNQYAGPENAGKTLILEEGMKWSAMAMNSADLEFLAQRKYQVTDIARIFRVPPHMIADLDRATFSNVEQQSIDFVVHTIRPWLVRWEKAIYRDLIGMSTYFAEFAIDGLLRGDAASRHNAYALGLQNGIYSINDVRAFENLNPIPHGDTHRAPMNMVDIAAPPPDPNAAKPAPPPSARAESLKYFAADVAKRIAAAEFRERQKMKGAITPEWEAKFAASHDSYIIQSLAPFESAGIHCTVAVQSIWRQVANTQEDRQTLIYQAILRATDGHLSN